MILWIISEETAIKAPTQQGLEDFWDGKYTDFLEGFGRTWEQWKLPASGLVLFCEFW